MYFILIAYIKKLFNIITREYYHYHDLCQFSGLFHYYTFSVLPLLQGLITHWCIDSLSSSQLYGLVCFWAALVHIPAFREWSLHFYCCYLGWLHFSAVINQYWTPKNIIKHTAFKNNGMLNKHNSALNSNAFMLLTKRM